MSKHLRINHNERTLLLQQTSYFRNSSSKSKECRSKETNLNKQYQQNPRKKLLNPKNHKNSKEKSCSKIVCQVCQKFKSKLKKKQEQFCKVVELHRSEIQSLNKINQNLREELQKLSEKLKGLEAQIQKYKDRPCRFQNGQRLEQLISCSPIEEKQRPVTLKIITEKLSEQAGPTTLSQLLAATPQPSQLGPNPLQVGEKQNALRSEFQRLMNQCLLAETKSKKMTLRRQLASIANQLSIFEKENNQQ